MVNAILTVVRAGLPAWNKGRRGNRDLIVRASFNKRPRADLGASRSF